MWICKILFQSTPSYEGERPRSSRAVRLWGISIHSLIRGRTSKVADWFEAEKISIHSLIRGRTALRSLAYIGGIFQSTPSYEGELGRAYRGGSSLTFQSTPSYEGEHKPRSDTLIKIAISIHSLIRGRTAKCHNG